MGSVERDIEIAEQQGVDYFDALHEAYDQLKWEEEEFRKSLNNPEELLVEVNAQIERENDAIRRINARYPDTVPEPLISKINRIHKIIFTDYVASFSGHAITVKAQADTEWDDRQYFYMRVRELYTTHMDQGDSEVEMFWSEEDMTILEWGMGR